MCQLQHKISTQLGWNDDRLAHVGDVGAAAEHDARQCRQLLPSHQLPSAATLLPSLGQETLLWWRRLQISASPQVFAFLVSRW